MKYPGGFPPSKILNFLLRKLLIRRALNDKNRNVSPKYPVAI